MTHVLHVSGPYSRWFPRFTKGGEILGRVGTREYLAPEVWSGKYSEKVDIFTAGALGYLCLKGKYPEFSWWRLGWPKCPFQCFWKRPGARPSAAQALAHPFCHAARWEIWVWTYRENSFCWHLGKFRSFQNDFQGSHLATRSSGAWERRSTSPRGPKHTEAVVFFLRRSFAVPLRSVQTSTSSKVSNAEEVPLGMLRLFCTTRAKALMRHSCRSATLLSQE